jgi:hypothetical protein
MAATRTELEHAVSLTLGDFIDDYDIPAIVGELAEKFGPLDSLDQIEPEDYWPVVEKHDTTAEGSAGAVHALRKDN